MNMKNSKIANTDNPKKSKLKSITYLLLKDRLGTAVKL